MANKTAIDILLDKLESLGFIEDKEDLLYESIVGECKKIEKEQIIEAVGYGNDYLYEKGLGEEYYNKTFK